MRKTLVPTLRHIRGRLIKALSILAAAAIFIINHSPAMIQLREMPEVLFAEDEAALEARIGEYSQKGISVSADAGLDERLDRSSVLLCLPSGLPVRSIPVFIGERPGLAPGGEAVGISIRTRGVLIVGINEFKDINGRNVSPAAEAGLKPGDIVTAVNGIPIASSAELSELIADSPDSTKLEIERGGVKKSIRLTPALSQEGSRKIGAWVRDSTVGVGTLSFFDPASREYAALGHPVLDPDTGTLMEVRNGDLVLAQILGITKGRQGVPGELHGSFSNESEHIGSIIANTELGISGFMETDNEALLSKPALPAAFPDEVKLGEAVLLSSASGRLEEYSCRIIRAGKQSEPAPKGLVIEITDERLLELTGGIVQGMSGSPIIQDGRLVGAVTHVFVNDPKKGYGAYAYWMYKVFGGRF